MTEPGSELVPDIRYYFSLPPSKPRLHIKRLRDLFRITGGMMKVQINTIGMDARHVFHSYSINPRA